MWKDSIRNIVVIFQPNILRIVGFYVRHSANEGEGDGIEFRLPFKIFSTLLIHLYKKYFAYIINNWL